MGKDEIKVIKRTKIVQAKQNKDLKNLKKCENKIQIKIGNVVKDWVSERQENIRKERSDSESNILAWKVSGLESSERTK